MRKNFLKKNDGYLFYVRAPEEKDKGRQFPKTKY